MTVTSADIFCPADGLDEFVRSTFLNEDSALYNDDHIHLKASTVAYLWTNVYNERGGSRIVGTCEIPTVQGNKWTRARHEWQMRQWFGAEANINFLITLDTNWMNDCGNINFLSTLEHELYHAGHKKDKFGNPDFDAETGLPKLALVGHDVEEFNGIMRRYGVKGCAGKTEEFVRLSKQKPEIAAATIASMCGNCVR